MPDSPLARAPLGHEVDYPTHYDPNLLFAIERTLNRSTLSVPAQWYGADLWTAYEISWLNGKGKPIVAIGHFKIPHDSPRLIESKSFKLYLNSFNEQRFDHVDAVRALMVRDLTDAVGQAVEVGLYDLASQCGQPLASLAGDNIDAQDIEIDQYEPAPELLQCSADKHDIVTESLVSDLLKSNCPVTGQPDWGSVQVSYTGPRIDRAALLKYIVSLRRHTEFHEHCVEKMFCEIQKACRPSSLSVYARYTRRGGLDINPWRSSASTEPALLRTVRQ